MKIDKESVEFDWDKGNIGKNSRHGVKDNEEEEVFFDRGKVVYKDKLHSQTEERFIILGKTKKGRLLYTAFTKRKNKIRIISARDISVKEKYLYEKTT